MLSLSNISTADEICIYANQIICIRSSEDGELYWFSRDGFPWGTRENISFLRHNSYDEADRRDLTSNEAAALLEIWRTTLNLH